MRYKIYKGVFDSVTLNFIEDTELQRYTGCSFELTLGHIINDLINQHTLEEFRNIYIFPKWFV